MKNETTTIRINVSQLERAKIIKDTRGKNIKEIFEDGLILNENKKDHEYNILLNKQYILESELIGHKAKVEHKRRELRIIPKTYQEALCDVLTIWEDSGKDLNSFCDDKEELSYLARLMGKFNEFGNMEQLKRILKEKKNFYKQTTFKKDQ